MPTATIPKLLMALAIVYASCNSNEPRPVAVSSANPSVAQQSSVQQVPADSTVTVAPQQAKQPAMTRAGHRAASRKTVAAVRTRVDVDYQSYPADTLELKEPWGAPMPPASKESSPATTVALEERRALPNTKAGAFFGELKPLTQLFAISPEADHLITGQQGTKVFVPKNSFVQADGTPVTGKVDLALVEVLTVADFVRTNLQTLSHGQPLQSEGMFFLDARSNGQPVNMAQGKELQVEMTNMNWLGASSDARIFTGSHDEAGNINWSEAGTMSRKMVPMPLEVFDYVRWRSRNFDRRKGEGYWATGPNYILDSFRFKQDRLVNTFIATREFQRRFWDISSAEFQIGYYTCYATKTAKKGTIASDSALTNIYLNNLDKDLWYCDSLAYDYLTSWKGKIEFKKFYGEADGEYYNLVDAFKTYYEQRLTVSIVFPEGVDFGSDNARQQLAGKGYSEAAIDELMGAYTTRTTYIESRNNKKGLERLSTNSFSVAKLGWINCDRYYNDPRARETNIMASVYNGEGFDFVSLALIINGQRVALNGMPTKGATYAFTGKSAPYTKLPIGEKATIVALSYRNKQPYIGMQEITIEEKGNYPIQLEASTAESINTKLAGLK